VRLQCTHCIEFKQVSPIYVDYEQFETHSPHTWYSERSSTPPFAINWIYVAVRLFGASSLVLGRLQSIQNASARFILKVSKYDLKRHMQWSTLATNHKVYWLQTLPISTLLPDQLCARLLYRSMSVIQLNTGLWKSSFSWAWQSFYSIIKKLCLLRVWTLWFFCCWTTILDFTAFSCATTFGWYFFFLNTAQEIIIQ